MVKKMFAVCVLSTFVFNICTFNVLANTTQPSLKPAHTEELSGALSAFRGHFKSLDLFEWPYPVFFSKNNVEEYQSVVEQHLQEMYALNEFEIAPGCLPPYAFAFFDIFFLTPLLAGFTVTELYAFRIDVTCAWASFFGTLVPFTWGLINWIDYRICAEQNADNPDQQTLDLLEEDRFFLVRISFVFLAATIVWGTACGWDNIFGGLFRNVGR